MPPDATSPFVRCVSIPAEHSVVAEYVRYLSVNISSCVLPVMPAYAVLGILKLTASSRSVLTMPVVIGMRSKWLSLYSGHIGKHG